MKNRLIMSFIIICLISFFCAYICVKQNDVMKKLDDDDLIKRINDETVTLLDQLELMHESMWAIYDEAKVVCPALYSIGERIRLFSGDSSSPACVQVRYSSFMSSGFVLVYDPRYEFINSQTNLPYEVVGDNIYVLRDKWWRR